MLLFRCFPVGLRRVPPWKRWNPPLRSALGLGNPSQSSPDPLVSQGVGSVRYYSTEFRQRNACIRDFHVRSVQPLSEFRFSQRCGVSTSNNPLYQKKQKIERDMTGTKIALTFAFIMLSSVCYMVYSNRKADRREEDACALYEKICLVPPEPTSDTRESMKKPEKVENFSESLDSAAVVDTPPDLCDFSFSGGEEVSISADELAKVAEYEINHGVVNFKADQPLTCKSIEKSCVSRSLCRHRPGECDCKLPECSVECQEVDSTCKSGCPSSCPNYGTCTDSSRMTCDGGPIADSNCQPKRKCAPFSSVVASDTMPPPCCPSSTPSDSGWFSSKSDGCVVATVDPPSTAGDCDGSFQCEAPRQECCSSSTVTTPSSCSGSTSCKDVSESMGTCPENSVSSSSGACVNNAAAAFKTCINKKGVKGHVEEIRLGGAVVNKPAVAKQIQIGMEITPAIRQQLKHIKNVPNSPQNAREEYTVPQNIRSVAPPTAMIEMSEIKQQLKEVNNFLQNSGDNTTAEDAHPSTTEAKEVQNIFPQDPKDFQNALTEYIHTPPAAVQVIVATGVSGEIPSAPLSGSNTRSAELEETLKVDAVGNSDLSSVEKAFADSLNEQ